jgi:hypothetical protein
MLPLYTTRTLSSGKIPVDIYIEDATDQYNEIDQQLFYYKITVHNSSLNFKVKVPFQTIQHLGYRKANSQAWTDSFWGPFYWYEGICIGITSLAALPFIQSACSDNRKIAHDALSIGTAAAFLGLFVQLCRHNKPNDLASNLLVNTAYPAIFVTEIQTYIQKTNAKDSMIFCTDHPLQGIEIDIYQLGTFYEVSLNELERINFDI